jgi:hypothetical protein
MEDPMDDARRRVYHGCISSPVKKHDWKLVDISWSGPETVFIWKCPGCGLCKQVYAPPSVGEHAAMSYKPIEGSDCDDMLVEIIMTS